MHRPEWRVADGDIGDQHVGAAIGLDEVRPQVMPGTVDSLRHWHRRFGLASKVAAVSALPGLAWEPAKGWIAEPWPPAHAASLAVEGALAGDRDVGLSESVDQR